MKTAILSLALVLSLSLAFSVSCGSNGQPPSGELPILKVGDTWTWRTSVNGTDFTRVDTITGEQEFNGIDCYTGTSQETSTTADKAMTAL